MNMPMQELLVKEESKFTKEENMYLSSDIKYITKHKKSKKSKHL